MIRERTGESMNFLNGKLVTVKGFSSIGVIQEDGSCGSFAIGFAPAGSVLQVLTHMLEEQNRGDVVIVLTKFGVGWLYANEIEKI